jgi:hypothetical protein
MVSEGFYPPGDWEIYPQIYHCDVQVPPRNRKKHVPHTWVPEFIVGDDEAPDFHCGGWPRKIVDIEDARDRK